MFWIKTSESAVVEGTTPWYDEAVVSWSAKGMGIVGWVVLGWKLELISVGLIPEFQVASLAVW